MLLSSTVRELPGKSPKTSGEARGSLTPCQRLAKFVSKIVRDAETTILVKFAVFEGVGEGEIYENCPKMLCFSWGNSMTIKFGNFANFIVRNSVAIWEAPK